MRSAIRFEPASEPPRDEWFLPGTEQTVIRAASATALARIAYPADGSIIALDPDIPHNRQRLPLRLSTPAATGWRWQLDGKPLARADTPATWLPQPGRHRLQLLDPQGSLADSGSFEVRAMKGRR